MQKCDLTPLAVYARCELHKRFPPDCQDLAGDLFATSVKAGRQTGWVSIDLPRLGAKWAAEWEALWHGCEG